MSKTYIHILYIVIILVLVYLGVRQQQRMEAMCQEQRQIMLNEVIRARDSVNDMYLDHDLLVDSLNRQRDLNVHLIYQLKQKKSKPFTYKKDTTELLKYFEDKFDLEIIEK